MSGIRSSPLRIVLGVVVAGALTIGALIALKVIDVGGDSGKLRSDWQRGMNLTAFLPEAYADSKAQAALETAKGAGTELVALTPTSYMAASTSSEIAADPAKVNLMSADEIEHAFACAKPVSPLFVASGTNGGITPGRCLMFALSISGMLRFHDVIGSTFQGLIV